MYRRICIRRFLNLFLVLYRCIILSETCVRVPDPTSPSGYVQINVHHAVAGSDDFDNISMNWDLMPGAKLNYMHDFPGMYNCVSQVTYFHNSKYEKRMQIIQDSDGISRGDYDPIHALPCLMQIYPEIEVLFEENRFDPSNQSREASWVMCGKRIYLLVRGKGVMYHPNPCVALAAFQKAGVF